MHGLQLPGAVGGEDIAVCIVAKSDGAQQRVNVVAVSEGGVEAFEHEDTCAFADDQTVGVAGEWQAAAAGDRACSCEKPICG